MKIVKILGEGVFVGVNRGDSIMATTLSINHAKSKKIPGHTLPKFVTVDPENDCLIFTDDALNVKSSLELYASAGVDGQTYPKMLLSLEKIQGKETLKVTGDLNVIISYCKNFIDENSIEKMLVVVQTYINSQKVEDTSDKLSHL